MVGFIYQMNYDFTAKTAGVFFLGGIALGPLLGDNYKYNIAVPISTGIYVGSYLCGIYIGSKVLKM
jgi:hypothetical protein